VELNARETDAKERYAVVFEARERDAMKWREIRKFCEKEMKMRMRVEMRKMRAWRCGRFARGKWVEMRKIRARKTKMRMRKRCGRFEQGR